MPLLRSGDRACGEFVVADGQRDPHEFGIVGGVVREQREDRQTLCVAKDAQPPMRILGITQRHGMRGKVPCCVAPYAGRGRPQHVLADPGEFAGPPLVAHVDLQPTEPGHAGRVDDPDDKVCVATAEAAVQGDRRVR